MKARIYLLITAILMLSAAAWPAAATISILVDEIHGRPLSEELAEALPLCDITPLTAASFPFADLIDTGFIDELNTEIFFTVSESAETLYLQFEFSSTDYQLPFITLFGPGDVRLGSHCEGSMHFEDPQPGEYRLSYSSWGPNITSYKIGTGPALFTADLLEDYDLVCNLWDDTMLLFRGELPRYSAQDEAGYLEYLENGGGFLFVREPLIEMVLKPVINIYSDVPVDCDLDLGFPGILTFAEPSCVTQSDPAGTWLRWHDLSVAAGQPTQILYEGKLRRQTNWLQLETRGDLPRVTNRTDQSLNELNLIRHEGQDNWRLVRVGNLAAGDEVPTLSGELLNGAALKTGLENIIRDGGRRAGLYPAEIEEFLAHYHWADRWLVDALNDGQWCGLYRIGDAAYEDHITFRSEPAALEKVRTMWIWATGLGDDPGDEPPSGPEWSSVFPSIGATAPIIYHEYGVQYQRGSGSESYLAKSFDFLGWSFHDEAALLDPTDNCGGADCPWFTMFGGHPDAEELMTDVSVVVGYFPGAISAPWSEKVLIGDDDAMTDDWVYPPGSYPPVSAAKSVGLGRAAAIHTMTILEEEQDNRLFLNNVVKWLANPVSETPDTPARLSRIRAVTPNPFNPRLAVSFTMSQEQPVTITVCDLSGKKVATLVDEVYSIGDHEAIWNGQDDRGRALPSGGYLIHLVTSDAHQTRKAMLVR